MNRVVKETANFRLEDDGLQWTLFKKSALSAKAVCFIAQWSRNIGRNMRQVGCDPNEDQEMIEGLPKYYGRP